MDSFDNFIFPMGNSEEFIKMNLLKDGYAYQIFSNNAYVGIWCSVENSFLISRYKVGAKPYVFYEAHWDDRSGIFPGTVKPLKEIEKAPPFEISNDGSNEEILSYLDDLEVTNPIVEGCNTLENRKNSAMAFYNRLRGV
jgi:hypothetical protein